MYEEILHELLHSALTTVKLLPLLFLTYLLMEYLEHHEEGKLSKVLVKAKGAGPVFGALIGLIPQCGFSGAASSLFAGGTITVGTLLAVFLATSDEMLPILISSHMPIGKIVAILSVKFLCAAFVGFLVDGIARHSRRHRDRDIHDFCEQEHCSCDGGIFRSALRHTLKISLLILVVLMLLNVLFIFLPRETIASFCGIPVLGETLTAVIGLMPNCAASVMITNLYVEGVIGAGPMLSGLLTNAGVGLLVLFRVNHNKKENFTIGGALLLCGVALGTVLGILLAGIL